jgi:PHP family Zn ribbon phosphoesterase
MDKLKEIIRKKLAEMSATNVGGASMSAGQGDNYATPAAFAKKTNSKGAKNIYYYKLGFKPVPDKIKGSGLEVKKLWEDETLNEINDFQKRRLASLDEIEKLMNEISPLISNAKNDTIELYSGNAGSYDITQPIEMVKSYLTDIKELLSNK